MTLAAEEIRIAANGQLFVAPVGTALPTKISDPLDAAFVGLGYANEDGATINPERTIEQIRAWQSRQPLRTTVTEESISIALTMIQWNENTLPMFFGGGTVTEDAGPPKTYVYAPPAPGEILENAVALEWNDGANKYRLVAERGQGTDTGEITLTGTSEAPLPLTLELLAPLSGGALAGLPFNIQTDDPNFGTA